MKAVSDKDFEAKVLKASKDKPVMVKFTADWCGPCRALAPVLVQLSEQYGEKLEIVELDTDSNTDTARRYNISSIPTLIVFKDGQMVKNISGAKPKSVLERELAEWIG